MKHGFTATNQTFFSRCSMVLSSVCLVHCLAMPVVILLIPAMAHMFSETVEIALVFMIFPISMIAFLPVWTRHKSMKLLRIFIASLLLIFLSQFIFHLDHFVYTSASIAPGNIPMSILRGITMFAGAIGLAWALFRVKKHTHVCTNPAHTH